MATLLEIKKLFESMPDDEATLEYKVYGIEWKKATFCPSLKSNLAHWRWKPGPVHPPKGLRIELDAEYGRGTGPAVLIVKLFREDKLLSEDSISTEFFEGEEDK